MAKMSRDKGKRGEREVAGLLRCHGFDSRRGVQYQGGPDSPDVVGLPGFHIEVKRTERLSIYPAMDQAADECKAGEVPVVFHRTNGSYWLTIIEAEQFLRMCKRLEELEAK